MREIAQGNTYAFKFIIKTIDGSLRDLSGVHDIKYIIADNVGAPTAFIQKDITSPDITIIDAVAGELMIKLTNLETKNLPIQNAYHEAVICDGAGNVTTILSEEIEIVDRWIIDC